MNLKVTVLLLLSILMFSVDSITAKETASNKKEKSPRIINIVNFIRQTDYRLENSDALAIVSVRAVTRELMSGVLKVIDITDFSAERMFSFVQLQGQSGGLEESFIRYMQAYK